MSITKWFVDRRRIPDNPPPKDVRVDVVVGMALSPRIDKTLGDLNVAVLETCQEALEGNALKFYAEYVFSNGTPVLGVEKPETLAEAQKNWMFNGGMPIHQITIPDKPECAGQNTYTEADFVFDWISLNYTPTDTQASILIVADPIHMHRVLAVFRKLNIENDILYWINADTLPHYGRGYAQKRFLHPLFFIGYEELAMTYFKTKGWV